MLSGIYTILEGGLKLSEQWRGRTAGNVPLLDDRKRELCPKKNKSNGSRITDFEQSNPK